MQQLYQILIGMGFLLLGFPIGNLLAKVTKDEKREGQKWFRFIIILSGIGAIISLIIGNDFLFFSFLFFMVITSQSLNKKRNRKKINVKSKHKN